MRHDTTPSVRHSRALFLSDFHLGAKSCRADRVLAFLQANTADTIYLVGDIFDTWVPMRPNWTPAHDAVVQTVLARAQSGTRVVYLPGNHDTPFGQHCGTYFGSIEVCHQTRHTTATGQRLLVLHGDTCDLFLNRYQWIAKVGVAFDSGLRKLSLRLNRLLRRLDLPPQSAIETGINLFNLMLRQSDRHERRLLALAQAQGLNGVVCGHFHKPALHDDHGMVYANCGDWVENFTALAEDADGTLCLLWTAGRPVALAPPPPLPVVAGAGLAGAGLAGPILAGPILAGRDDAPALVS